MATTVSKIVDLFEKRTLKSRELARRARNLFPSGVTHDARFLEPYPIYVERAQGSRKWDVDGHEYVDYSGGHGALLLGHLHPQVMPAVHQQLEKGTHYGAGHELEVRWGEVVKRLIPSAQRVRFTSSGTEATMLAMRLARAFTGRQKVMRFAGHFHGWHDHAAFGVGSHFDGTPTPGVPDTVAQQIVLAPANDIDTTGELMQDHQPAAVILEPTGASWGKVPLRQNFLSQLREITAELGIILIFDEVITGFRCSPGGAQAFYQITPDLTTLAKILAGGLPGGALCGRQEIMHALDFPDQANGQKTEKVAHHGTFNANPVSAAAGVATLEIIESSDVCQRASDYAGRLRDEMTRVLRDEAVNWVVYGSHSGFHIFTNPDGLEITSQQVERGDFDYRVLKSEYRQDLLKNLRLGMLLHGVELFSWPGGPTSAVHTDDDLEQTVEAFRQTLHMLKEEHAI